MKPRVRERSTMPARTSCSGKRHWFGITGLPGWKRAELRMPAFGQSDCAEKRAEAPQHAASAETNVHPRPGIVWLELRAHIPFTALGTLSGVLLLAVLILSHTPRTFSITLFWTLHPLHVLLSALVTTAMFRRHGGRGFWATIALGYLGSVGIATLSDCLLPYAGEWILALPHRGLHLGFIEKWWLVNPLAVGGILVGFIWTNTKFPHAGHVFLSTWASLFHITMALGTAVTVMEGALIALFLFLSVWLPCCTSDIVFPLLFAPKSGGRAGNPEGTSHPRL